MKRVKFNLEDKIYDVKKYRVIKIGAFNFIIHVWKSKYGRKRISLHEERTGLEITTHTKLKDAVQEAKYWLNELSSFYISYYTTSNKLNSID